MQKAAQAAQPKMMEIMTELVNRFLTTRQPQHIMMPAAVVGYVPTPAGINSHTSLPYGPKLTEISSIGEFG